VGFLKLINYSSLHHNPGCHYIHDATLNVVIFYFSGDILDNVSFEGRADIAATGYVFFDDIAEW
jgi:hypothetical protein